MSEARCDVLMGVDVGTTRVKAVTVGLDGTELAAAAAGTPWVVDGNSVEMDAHVLADTVRSVVAAALDQDDRARVTGLGVTGMGEAGVLLDRAGRPTAPIIAWYDPRGDVELVAKELPDLPARTGVPFSPVATIFKLPALLRGGNGVRWLNVAEWVVRSLGGDEVAEMSLAGRTGMCDLHTATWWPDALEFLGVDGSFLPGEPSFGTTGAGQATFEPIAGARLAVGGHDHQVAGYVAGAAEPGCLFESLGTADAIAFTVPAPVDPGVVLDVVDFGATIGRTVMPDRLMAMMGLRTGQILERIARLLGYHDRDQRKALAARAATRGADAGSSGDPALTVALVDGLVSITGIGDATDAEALWLAAVEAADARIAAAVTRYAELFGPATSVVVGGGWLNDPAISAAVDRRFPTARRSRFAEPGAVGAACIAGISAGLLDGPFDGVAIAERRVSEGEPSDG